MKTKLPANRASSKAPLHHPRGYYTHYQPTDKPMMHDWLQPGVRFYNPDMGRFERRDPVEREPMSAYIYADGTPTSLVDPSGELAFLACMAEPQCRAGVACLAAAFGSAVWTVIKHAGSPQGFNFYKLGVNSPCSYMTSAAFAATGKPSAWLSALLEEFSFPAVFDSMCPSTLNKHWGCDDCDKYWRPRWLYPEVRTH